MAEEPRLEHGQEGEWVQYLQQSLQHRGIEVGAADGKFGDTMHQAVAQFQAASGLSPDGVVDSLTWAALVRESAPEQAVDERQRQFELAAYPLLAMMAEFGEGEGAVKPFLLSRGVDESFVDMMLASQ